MSRAFSHVSRACSNPVSSIAHRRNLEGKPRSNKPGGPVASEQIADLAAASRILAAQGVVDGFGHVSMRHPSAPERYLMARSIAPALVTPEDIIEYNLDSDPINANGRGSFLERFIHGEIYKARADIQSIVHSHSPSVVPFGLVGVPMQAMFHNAAFIAMGVPVFDIRAKFGATDMLVGNAEKGVALSEVMGRKDIVLMHSDLLDSNGHCSIRLDDNRILINIGSCQRSRLTVDDICIIDLEANQIEGKGNAPLERHLHCGIYRVRSDVKAIVHAHPKWSTFLTMVGESYKPVYAQGSLVHPVPLLDSPNSINNRAMADRLAATLGDRPAALMKSHGAVTVGKDIVETFVLANYLEEKA